MAAATPGTLPMTPMHRRSALVILALLACVLLLPGCASTGKGEALQRAQYAWSAAIRWGDFEGAWNLVDPAHREQNPLSEVEFERYNHIQVSHYRELGAQSTADGMSCATSISASSTATPWPSAECATASPGATTRRRAPGGSPTACRTSGAGSNPGRRGRGFAPPPALGDNRGPPPDGHAT